MMEVIALQSGNGDSCFLVEWRVHMRCYPQSAGIVHRFQLQLQLQCLSWWMTKKRCQICKVLRFVTPIFPGNSLGHWFEKPSGWAYGLRFTKLLRIFLIHSSCDSSLAVVMWESSCDHSSLGGIWHWQFLSVVSNFRRHLYIMWIFYANVSFVIHFYHIYKSRGVFGYCANHCCHMISAPTFTRRAQKQPIVPRLCRRMMHNL